MYEKLADITSKIGSGSTPKGGEKSYKTQGVSFIRSQNVLDFYFSKKNLFFIDEKQAEILNGVTVKEGDILLNITGDSVARCCIVADEILPARVNQHVAIIRSLDRKLSYFLMYYLQFMKPHLLTICKIGGTRKALTKEMLENLPIIANGNHQQIGFTLAKIDKKISINNSIISKLGEMAKTIYEYWFLQFDFPNQEGKPYASSGGAMKYSKELGREIPIDWEAIEIDKICKIYSGFAFKSTQYVKEGKYRLITIKNVQENGVLLEPANFIDELPKKLPAYCLLEQRDILMSLTGNVGRVGLMFDDMCLLNQRVAKICPSDEEMRGLIYFLFKSTFVKSKMENMAGGTSQENLSPIETGKILIPYNEKIFRSFSKVANQWVSMIVKKQRENQKLTQLRDWLLPMLMNGQARVE